MKTNEVRQRYLEFFKSKNHDILESASLIPQNDPSLLLVGAGMAPFKDYFTGKMVRDNPKVTTCQKCIRTGDIDNVGKTARHHTFFEMLGNFSFGDYFKEQAIAWAWEFLTKELKLDTERLWVSVYVEDDEAYDIWKNSINIPQQRIVRLGKKDNFWEVGVGPCGPCSEIYVDLGDKFGCGSPICKPGCDCDRYLEIWNLVFTQFDKDETGNYHSLTNKNIDTGMGLERVAAVMQGVPNNFEIDSIFPIIQFIEGISGKKYGVDKKTDKSLKVIADHTRATVFMVSDGVLPSNEGRGYVLRRLLRRAVRHGMLLGIKEQFMYRLVDIVIELMKDPYPELEQKRDYLIKIISIEEERFAQTLEQGMMLLEDELRKLKQGEIFPGTTAFKLYDTYGFPLDLTKEILQEKGFVIDENSYNEQLEVQRNRARLARGDVDAMGTQETLKIDSINKSVFLGYHETKWQQEIKSVIIENKEVDKCTKGETASLVFAETTFYPQGGGQLGDTGKVITDTGVFQVKDTQKIGNFILLQGESIEGTLVKGQSGKMAVDQSKRHKTQNNHTATHILHKALREVLGTHVEQAGSEVGPERLRFDFSHYGAITQQELDLIQAKVNEIIGRCLPVTAEETDIDTAKSKGAMALFGEKYDKDVRIVYVGDYSLELCGGTHADNTGKLRYFKILGEGGIGSGLRRIEAVTGDDAFSIFEKMQGDIKVLAQSLKCQPAEVVQKAEALILKIKEQEKELANFRQKMAGSQKDQILAKKVKHGELDVFVSSVDVSDANILRELADSVVENKDMALVVLGSVIGDKVNFVAKTTKKGVEHGVHCGKIIKVVAQTAGGGGGGRPDMAQAGGKLPEKIEEALDKVFQVIE